MQMPSHRKLDFQHIKFGGYINIHPIALRENESENKHKLRRESSHGPDRKAGSPGHP